MKTTNYDTDEILDLSCNIDDMTGEELGYAMDVLLDAGALDVFYQPIQMKKNRPGVLLHCFCHPADQDKYAELMFRHTTTRGIRFETYGRYKLVSRFESLSTPYGEIQNKISTGGETTKSKLEFEDLKQIAQKTGLSLFEIKEKLFSLK